MNFESIAHYRITDKIGEGGMGAVYRAIDTKLNREVAIKVLPDALANDPDYIARFTREAQVLASLNHPNIATIHGVEERALVMELVPGPTLEEKIAGGPIALNEALVIARQIAEALEAAHEKGIVHRDLKPANVKVTPDGLVKVLDFGLAKVPEAVSGASTVNSPTLTVRATKAGIIMGTAGYMSPEQARGMPVDKRADIWAFGVVLHEMLTGQQTFGGETVSDTLASVLKTDPDFTRLPAETPASVRRLLIRCLERDRRKRLHDIGDARLEIDAAGEAELPPAVAVPPQPVAVKRSWTMWAPWLVAALGIPLAYWLRTPPPVEAIPVRFQIMPPEGHRFGASGAVVSPDGRYLVASCISSSGERALWLRDLSTLAWRRLAEAGSASAPFWSPDSTSVGFAVAGKLKRVPVAGGSPQTLTDTTVFRGAAWSRHSVIVLSEGGAIGKVDASGGNISPLIKAGTSGIASPRWPSLLPDDKRFVFDGRPGIFVGAVDGAQSPRKVLDAEDQPMYAAGPSGESGYLLFRRGEGLMAAPFDARRAEVTGEAFRVADTIPRGNNGNIPVSTADSGRALVIYDLGPRARFDLVVLDRAGKVLQRLPAEQTALSHLELSPDGARLLGNRVDARSRSDLWAMDVKRATISRVTNDAGRETPGVWSVDGSKVYYVGDIDGKSGLFVTASDGSGQSKLVTAGDFHHLGASMDGKHLAMEMAPTVRSAKELAVYNLERGKLETVVKSAFIVGHPSFSPDGRWMGYTSAETGRSEVYVQSFPPGNGRWQISTDSGFQMRWRRDGKEMFYKDAGGAIMSVTIQPKGTGLEFGTPIKLFDTGVPSSTSGTYFSATADGSRFYAYIGKEDQSVHPLTVILNWTAGLKK